MRKKQFEIISANLQNKKAYNFEYFTGEDLIEGEYIKYSDNNGFVNAEVVRNTPHAFSHFTYHASQGKLVIVDIQGKFQKTTRETF